MKSGIQSTKAAFIDDKSILQKRNASYPSYDTSFFTALGSYFIKDTTSYFGIFAMYKKVFTYTGPLFTLRRASDNVEKDFYLTSDAAIWLNGTSGFVKVWYDQSGRGNNFIQTNTTLQPAYTILDSSIKQKASIDLGTTKGMVGFPAPSSGSHSFTLGYIAYTAGNRVLNGSNNWLIGPYNAVHNVFAGSFATGPAVVVNTPKIQTGYRLNNGSYFNRVNAVDVGSSAGSTLAGTLGLGVVGGFAEPAGSRIFEVLVKDSIQGLTEIQTLEKLINSYYSIF